MTTHGNAAIYVAGPWSHRSVSANGTRFHVAESGDGPLVLLLHGFPELAWSWRKVHIRTMKVAKSITI